MENEKVRIAQLGVGVLGSKHLEALYEDITDADVTAVYDPKFLDEEKRDDFESAYEGVTAYPTQAQVAQNQYDSVPDVLEDEDYILSELVEAHDVEAANIVTPHTAHYEQVKQLLESDVHVHIEKPMATSTRDAVDMQEMAEEYGLILQPGYQRAVHPFYMRMEDLVQEDMALADDPYKNESYQELGEMETINAHIKQDWWNAQKEAWRANGSLSGETAVDGDSIGWGMAGDTGSHLLQSVLQMTKTVPKTVTAKMKTRYGTGDAPVDINSSWLVELEQANGNTVLANLTINGDGGAHGFSEGIEVYGRDGEIVYDEENGEKMLRVNEDELAIDAETGYHNLNALKLEKFVDSVKHDKPPAVPTEYGTQVTALHEASYRSAISGEPVDVQELLADAYESLLPEEQDISH